MTPVVLPFVDLLKYFRSIWGETTSSGRAGSITTFVSLVVAVGACTVTGAVTGGMGKRLGTTEKSGIAAPGMAGAGLASTAAGAGGGRVIIGWGAGRKRKGAGPTTRK
jgi:hypothetical protein